MGGGHRFGVVFAAGEHVDLAGEGSGGPAGDLGAVDGDGAGQRGGQGLGAGDLAEQRVAGEAAQGGVGQDPAAA